MHGTIQKLVLEATEICANEMKIDKMDNLAKDFGSSIEELRKGTDRIIEEKYTAFLKVKEKEKERKKLR